MLAVVAAGGAQLDAGSVGLAVARRWSDSGEGVLFVDADGAGSGLAQRLGEADRAEYSPAVRGLPSLMVAREPVTLRLLADHCYSLDTSGGSLWALLAPSHPAGARRAAAWLGESAAGLRAVDVERRVVVSSSLPAATDPVVPLLKAARMVTVLAPVESADAAKALWTACRDAGLHGFDRGLRVLIVEGDSPLGDDDLRTETGMVVAGRLPAVADDRLLRLQGGRRDRAFIKSLDRISARLLEASKLDAARGAGPGREPDAPAPPQPEPAHRPQPVSTQSPPQPEPAQAPPQPEPAHRPRPVSTGPAPLSTGHPQPVSTGPAPGGSVSARPEPRPQPVPPARPPGPSPAGSVPAPGQRAPEQGLEAPGRRRTTRRGRF